MTINYDRTLVISLTGGGGERIIQGGRVVLEVKKTLLSYPNQAKVSIYNSSELTRAITDKEDSKIDIVIGYNNNNRLVFSGDIRNTIKTREGADSILTLYAGDSQRSWENARINKTYKETVTLSTVVKDLIGTFEDVARGDLLGKVKQQFRDTLSGRTFSGTTRSILSMLARTHDFSWSIQDGKLDIIPNDQFKPDYPILINYLTGLVGSPNITEKGVECNVALNPKIVPNILIDIESSIPNIQLGNLIFREVPKTKGLGVYKVFEVAHKGDTYENQWISQVKGWSYDRLS